MLCLFPVTTKVKGVDLDAPGSINGVPVLEVDMESFEEKPWRKPGLLNFLKSQSLTQYHICRGLLKCNTWKVIL